MHLIADRKGKVWEEDSLQDRILEWMYSRAVGRLILRPLVSPVVSKIGGSLLSKGISRVLIKPFILSHSIDMSQLNRLRTFLIKHTRYTVFSLLKNHVLSEQYTKGYIWVFRLCVDDYHRYIYVDGGKESRRFRIPGVFHTVNPAAGDRLPVYKENTREYSILRSENFGEIIQMEVGAMFVGKIENRPRTAYVKRGEEKGNFAFGGSTVILMTKAGRVQPDKDILENSMRGIETKVKLGESIGKKICDMHA